MCVKCRDVCECIAIWRSVPEADVDVERLEFARNRVAKAAEGTSSLAPPQGVAANGTEGAPSESLVAPPQHAHVDFMPWQRWVVRRNLSMMRKIFFEILTSKIVLKKKISKAQPRYICIDR